MPSNKIPTLPVLKKAVQCKEWFLSTIGEEGVRYLQTIEDTNEKAAMITTLPLEIIFGIVDANTIPETLAKSVAEQITRSELAELMVDLKLDSANRLFAGSYMMSYIMVEAYNQYLEMADL